MSDPAKSLTASNVSLVRIDEAPGERIVVAVLAGLGVGLIAGAALVSGPLWRWFGISLGWDGLEPGIIGLQVERPRQ